MGKHYEAEDDAKLFNEWNVSFANVVPRATIGYKEITEEEWKNGVDFAKRKIARFRPRLVCCVGQVVYEKLFGEKNILGRAPAVLEWHNGRAVTRFFVLPSTSSIATKYSIESKKR